MPSAEIWLDGYHGLMQKPFQSLISLQSSSFTCSLFSKKGLPKVFMRLWIKVWCSAECNLKRKGVAKIDRSTLLIISSMECIIYWASNKSVHKQSTQQRFLFLGAFNVDGSPFLLFIINHNALTVRAAWTSLCLNCTEFRSLEILALIKLAVAPVLCPSVQLLSFHTLANCS